MTIDQTTTTGEISGDYNVDPSHSRIGFSVRHMMVTNVRGAFGAFEASAHIDAATPADSSVQVSIDTASIDTGVADRDAHLRSADFFDADNHPKITFASTKVERTDETTWLVTGDLTISGTSKPVTITFEETGAAKDAYGNSRVGFEGSTSISRKDWGLTWNAALEAGGVAVSDKVKLEFDISAIKA